MDVTVFTELMGRLDEERLMNLLDEFISTDPDSPEAQNVLNACQKGITIVGDLYETGEYYIGDLVFSGSLLTSVVDKLKPFLGATGDSKIGCIVLGTVKGDLHDIGKNIFRNMAEAAGFTVFDLGIDQDEESFVSKVKELKPQIVGLSCVLSFGVDAMKDTVHALQEAGLRDDVKIIIGGAPITKDSCDYSGADAFTTNAAEGVKICQSWIANN